MQNKENKSGMEWQNLMMVKWMKKGQKIPNSFKKLFHKKRILKKMCKSTPVVIFFTLREVKYFHCLYFLESNNTYSARGQTIPLFNRFIS